MNMFLMLLYTYFRFFIVGIVAFEDIIQVYGQISQDIIDDGRSQFELLREKGKLPKYGSCWKAAVEHVEEGCRNLSEDAQSNIALHITNCFLEMSGSKTYNCELAQKPNIKKICIGSMPDRAFHVYTEFYTHTQNMCWFLRGQIWHETISENTLRMGKHLELSTKAQEQILKSQKESLMLQENMLKYGKNLEKIMEEFYTSTEQHSQIFLVMSKSLGDLQSWLVGEFSWIEIIVFYISASIFVCILTSTRWTASARLPILLLLIGSAFLEHLLCVGFTWSGVENDIHSLQNRMYKCIWWLRRIFTAVAIMILIYKTFYYRDLTYINNTLLFKIYNQNLNISETLKRGFQNNLNDTVYFENDLDKSVENNCNEDQNAVIQSSNNLKREKYLVYKNCFVHTNPDTKDTNIQINNLNTNKRKPKNIKEDVNVDSLINTKQRNYIERYNLRSRNSTPDSKR